MKPHPHHEPSIVAVDRRVDRQRHTDAGDRPIGSGWRCACSKQAGHRVFDYAILPDEPEQVRRQVERWLAAEGCDGVVLNGGTGISVRDRTFEAVSGLLDKTLDGFGELFRALSFEQIGAPRCSAARWAASSGASSSSRLPGSTAAVELAMGRLIVPELGHLLGELRR